MKVLLSRHQRFELAALFCHKDLKLADLSEMKAFNRARLSLRLNPITDIILKQGAVLTKMIADDTGYVFDIELASAKFVLDKIAPFILENSYLSMLLGEFLVDGLERGDMAVDGHSIMAEAETWAAPQGEVVRTYDDLVTFFGVSKETPRADVLARAEEICSPAA